MKSKINVFDAANWGPWETFLLAGVLFIAIFSPAPANASHRDGHNYNPANDPSYGVPCPNIYNTSSYSQGSYSTYAQGSYSTYAQGSYYTQGQYYSQSQYYVQGAYINSPELRVLPKLVEKDSTTTLTWDGGNADSCRLTGGKFNNSSVSVIGSADVVITGETTFTIECFLGPQQSTHSVTVKVVPEIEET